MHLLDLQYLRALFWKVILCFWYCPLHHYSCYVSGTCPLHLFHSIVVHVYVTKPNKGHLHDFSVSATLSSGIASSRMIRLFPRNYIYISSLANCRRNNNIWRVLLGRKFLWFRSNLNLDNRPVWSVFAVRMKKARVLSYPLSAQWRLWSDWAYAQADLNLRWAHMPFCWFCH